MLDVGPGPGRHVWCAGRWLSESTSSPPSSCKVQGWTYVIVSFELRVFFGKGGHAAMYLWHFVQDHDFWRVVCSQCWSATKDIKRHPDWAGCEREMKAWGNAHTGQRLWFCINKSTDYFWMAWSWQIGKSWRSLGVPRTCLASFSCKALPACSRSVQSNQACSLYSES